MLTKMLKIFDQGIIVNSRKVKIIWNMTENVGTYHNLLDAVWSHYTIDDINPGLMSIFKHFYFNVPNFKSILNNKKVNFKVRIELQGFVIFRAGPNRKQEFDFNLNYFYEIPYTKWIQFKDKDFSILRSDFLEFGTKKLEEAYPNLSPDNIVNITKVITETTWKEVDEKYRPRNKWQTRDERFLRRLARKNSEK